MSQNEHPGERLLEFLRSIIARSQKSYNAGHPAKNLWCLATGIDASNRAAFVQNVRLFQEMLDDWKRFTLSTDTSTIKQDYVDKVYAELMDTVLNLGELTSEDLLLTCHRLETPVGIGIHHVSPDVPWNEDDIATLKDDVEEWRKMVLESSIEHIWKRNILEALDKVIDAIDNYETKGQNNLTDALVRCHAILRVPKVAVSLTKAGIGIASFLVEIVDRIDDGSPPMLPPGLTG